MADEEKEGFTFVDKRRTAEPPLESTQSPDSGSPNPTTDSQDDLQSASEPMDFGGSHDASGMPNLPKLDVRDRLLMCIDILNQGAWISLGLLSDPATGQVEPNLD